LPKVYVDISIHSEEEAVGMVSGLFEIRSAPRVGDTLNFGHPAKCDAMVEERGTPFVGELKVTAVLEPVAGLAGSDESLVMLETLVGRTRMDALKLMAFFEHTHQLNPEVWDRMA
jgi:hypothetical protein